MLLKKCQALISKFNGIVRLYIQFLKITSYIELNILIFFLLKHAVQKVCLLTGQADILYRQQKINAVQTCLEMATTVR